MEFFFKNIGIIAKFGKGLNKVSTGVEIGKN